MNSDLKQYIAIAAIAATVCLVVFGVCQAFDNLNKENQQLNKSIEDVKTQINESETASSDSSSNSGDSNYDKVYYAGDGTPMTYEEYQEYIYKVTH